MCSRLVWIVLIFILITEITCRKPRKFSCTENGDFKIKNALKCNGKDHCPFGSDETALECKYGSMTSHHFYCAYGGLISQYGQCNKLVECADTSDESPSLCMKAENFSRIVRGKCNSGEMECQPFECIPINKKCDNTVDCTNGWDESVDLCMEICADNEFQCANGKCMSKIKLCDNHFDCVDGSDELPKVCNHTKLPVTCDERTDKGLRFTSDTRFHLTNGSRFVYANKQVQFECYDRSANFVGLKWNVCLNRGQWRNELPICSPEPKNMDPDTNGINGCPIDTYANNSDKLQIFKCEKHQGGSSCLIETIPPINQMEVMFACKSGYTLKPNDLANKPVGCFKKIWDLDTINKQLSCIKKCKPDKLYCHKSMKILSCKLDGRSTPCNQTLDLFPDTRVTFECSRGFKQTHYNVPNLYFDCQKNGSWSASSDVNTFCTPDCGIEKIPLAKDVSILSPSKSPWSVAIYMKKISRDKYDYVCAGSLIRPKLVLTAAHCFKTVKTPSMIRVGGPSSNSSTVDKDFGTAVKEIKINDRFSSLDYDADTAILILADYLNDEFSNLICLPPQSIDSRLKNNTVGEVCAWNSTDSNSTSEYIGLAMVPVRTHKFLEDDKYDLRTLQGTKLCKGDSGSAFITHCKHEAKDSELMCLYGVLSYSNKGGSSDGCMKRVNIVEIVAASNMEFINEIILEESVTCDDV